VTNEEKEQLWRDYRAGCPQRVPVTLGTNNRVYLLDPRFNTEGLTYREVFEKPEKMLLAQLRWQELIRTHHHRYCDLPTGLPDRWVVGLQWQNVYEAWFFGCPVHFEPGQVPATTPILTDGNKRTIFDVDITRPFGRDPFNGVPSLWERSLEFAEQMAELARGFEYRGRPVEIAGLPPLGSDGPLTVAVNLRGSAFLGDLALDPDYADALMAFITEAAIIRARAIRNRWGIQPPDGDLRPAEVGLADDMIAAISVQTYTERVLPHHRRYYDALDPERVLRRTMHLCGDSGRHFPAIVAGCGISSFDTGFPLDFAAVRRAVGPSVEILGGVEVDMLLNGTPKAVYGRARAILTSGVLEGRCFILREANNLPPRVPMENLAAMYRAALEFGCY
jgi:hypothetical protein